MCQSHQFTVSETICTDIGTVKQALASVQNFEHFTSVVKGLEALSENEFSAIGRPLFLRDRISVRLVVPGSPQVCKLLSIRWGAFPLHFVDNVMSDLRSLRV